MPSALARVPYLPTAHALYAGNATYATQAGTASNANYLDGLDSHSFFQGYSGVQITQNTPLAAGGQNYWSTYGYNADHLVVW